MIRFGGRIVAPHYVEAGYRASRSSGCVEFDKPLSDELQNGQRGHGFRGGETVECRSRHHARRRRAMYEKTGIAGVHYDIERIEAIAGR